MVFLFLEAKLISLPHKLIIGGWGMRVLATAKAKAVAPNSQRNHPTRDVGSCGSMDAPKAPDPDANPRRDEGEAHARNNHK